MSIASRPDLPEAKLRLDLATRLVFPVVEHLIPETLDAALLCCCQGEWRFDLLSPARMLRLELLQACRPHQSFQETLREVWQTWRLTGAVTGAIPSSAALAQARARTPLWACETLFRHTASLVAELARQPLCPEFRLLSVDGIPLVLPRTQALLDHFGTTSNQRGDNYYPQATAVWVVQLPGRGVLAEWLGSANHSDQNVAPRLLPSVLRASDLVLGDAHIGTFPNLSVIRSAGASFLVRAPANLLPEKHVLLRHSEAELEIRLGPTYHVRTHYPDFRFPDHLDMRALRFPIPSCDACNGVEIATFLTDLPRNLFPLDRAAAIAALRWDQETIHGDVKTRMGLGDIRSQTPAGVHREVFAHLCCANFLRTLLSNTPVLELLNSSFTAALSALRQANQQLRLLPARQPEIVQVLQEMICTQHIAVRPGRSEPRKRRPSKRPFPYFTTPRSLWRQARKAG